MIGIPLGLLTANATEWLVHRYVLHGLGKKRSSFWAFHWSEHHRASRRSAMRDASYERSLRGWHAQSKEALAVFALGASATPLLPIAPFFTATIWYSAYNYYRVHKRSHLDPEWAREHLPWHYEHHMGRDQDSNWCVTRPWFDILLGTHRPYVTARARPDATPRRVGTQQNAA